MARRALRGLVDVVESREDVGLQSELRRSCRATTKQKSKRKTEGKSKRREDTFIMRVVPDVRRTTQIMLDEGAEDTLPLDENCHRLELATFDRFLWSDRWQT